MKAIRINVYDRTITEVDLGENSLKGMQKIVGGNIELAFGVKLGDNGDALFVNEEGLLNNPQAFQMWYYEAGEKYLVFAGNGVIVGTDDEGETVDVKVKAENVKRLLEFGDINTIQFYAALGRIAN